MYRSLPSSSPPIPSSSLPSSSLPSSSPPLLLPSLLLPSHRSSFPGTTPGVRPSRKMKKLNWSKIDQSRVISTPNNVWRRLSASEDGVGPLSPGDQMLKTLEELFSQRELSRVNAFRKKSQTSEKKKVVGGSWCYVS